MKENSIKRDDELYRPASRKVPDRHTGVTRPKIVPPAVPNRVERLVDLSNALLQEIETLARNQEFSDETGRSEKLLLSEGIDLFQEVKRFEINLIKLALTHTRGHQGRAAKLLNINPTTLNSKIKLYNIEDVEINLIRRALHQSSGHRARAAELLNIKVATLNSKIKRYGIDDDVLEARAHMAELFNATRNFGVGVRPSREEMHER